MNTELGIYKRKILRQKKKKTRFRPRRKEVVREEVRFKPKK